MAEKANQVILNNKCYINKCPIYEVYGIMDIHTKTAAEVNGTNVHCTATVKTTVNSLHIQDNALLLPTVVLNYRDRVLVDIFAGEV